MKYKENNHSSLAMVFWDFSDLGSAEAGQTWGYYVTFIIALKTKNKITNDTIFLISTFKVHR